ncbi:hypothetical protein Tco_1562897 [Tanacetum coccineum]
MWEHSPIKGWIMMENKRHDELMIDNHWMVNLLKEVLMIDELSIVETDKTGSSDGLQPKQADLSCVHALNEPHLHEIHVVPNRDGDLDVRDEWSLVDGDRVARQRSVEEWSQVIIKEDEFRWKEMCYLSLLHNNHSFGLLAFHVRDRPEESSLSWFRIFKHLAEDEEVAETDFMEKSSQSMEHSVHVDKEIFADPFGLNDLLGLKKPVVENLEPSPSLSRPPGFSPVGSLNSSDKELNKEFSPTISAKVMNNSQVVHEEVSFNFVRGSGNNKGGSVLGVLDEMIRVGRA